MTSGLNHTGIGLAEEGASDDEDIDMDYSMNMDPNNECMLDCVYRSLCSGDDLGMLNNQDTLITHCKYMYLKKHHHIELLHSSWIEELFKHIQKEIITVIFGLVNNNIGNFCKIVYKLNKLYLLI